MSVKIKDAVIVPVTGELKVPVGNTSEENQSSAVSVSGLKTFIDSDKSTVATTGNYNDLTNRPTIPTNTRSLLITYEDESTETIVVYVQ